MSLDRPKWGICSTLKASTPEILRFAAYHLDIGADLLQLYLDDNNHAAFDALRAHPRIHIRIRDAAWWSRRRQCPEAHQTRQTINATHAYRQSGAVDWLAHIDVDEFIIADQPVSDLLDAIPSSVQSARIRPMELLTDGDGTAYKRFVPYGPAHYRIVEDIFPTYGRYLRDGFLSHRVGKIFVRTGLQDIRLRIHRAFIGDNPISDDLELDAISLAHWHAVSWDDWVARYRYRLQHGSYSARFDQDRVKKFAIPSLHDFLRELEATQGEAGLRAFFREVSEDRPELRAKLAAHGILRIVSLDLDSAVARHFPNEV